MKYREVVDKILGRKQKPKPVGTSVVPVKKVAPPDPYRGFKKNKEINADIALTEDLFTQLAWWFSDGNNKEVTGFGVIDEECVVRWVCLTDTGTAGFVNNSAEGMIFAANEATNAGFDFVNMHWHTHPNMGPFYSSTDKEHHSRRMRDLQNLTEDGDMTFVVFDGIFWLTRRFIVTKTGVEWNDGLVSVGVDSEMSLPSEKPAVYARHSYGGDWVEDYVVAEKVTKVENVPQKQEEVVLFGGDWPCCEDCCQEFFKYGATLGKPGTVCSMCDEPIGESTTRLSTHEEQIADEAEDALDAYLGFLQDGHNVAALEAMTELAKTPVFDYFVELYEKRIKGKEDSVSLQMARHIAYFMA